MEDPVSEITPIIHLLCQSPPSLQRQTLERYFARDAEFRHPFCRTGRFDFKTGIKLGPFGDPDQYTCSRALILAIFRWYKILSPVIELEVDSVAFDERNLILYVTLHQIFKLLLIPRPLAAKVRLTTKLTLRQGSGEENSSEDSNGSAGKYYIIEQNDLYQVSEFVKFVDPLRLLSLTVYIWHLFATLLCVLGQFVLAPVSWWEDTRVGRHLETGDEIERRDRKTDIEKVD